MGLYKYEGEDTRSDPLGRSIHRPNKCLYPIKYDKRFAYTHLIAW